MTAADVLDGLLKANLAAGAAILAVVALRKLARERFGARLAYGLWLLPLLAGASVLLPARQVVVRTAAPMAASAVRIVHAVNAAPMAATAAWPSGLDASALLVALWLAGVATAILTMAVLQHRFVTRARRGGVGPAVVGVIAPRILIPRDFAERYNPGEQALVLAHEQAHLSRQDSRLNGLMAALQCACWFNPLVHLAARLMRVDQELACDEAVTNRFPDARRAYAEVLMKAQMAVMPLPLGCYWPSKGQHPLVERVAMLKRPRIGRARWQAGAVVLGCLWAGAGVAAWAFQPAEVRTVFKTAPTPDRSAPFALAKAEPQAAPVRQKRGIWSTTVQRVVIEGNHRVDQATILSKLAIRPGQVLKGGDLEAPLKRLYDTGQFAEFDVRLPPRGGSGDLILRVNENPLINKMAFEGNTNFTDFRLRSVMQLEPGDALSVMKMHSDADAIVELYREAGWPDAKVTYKVSDLAHARVDVKLVVHEGAKAPPGDLPTGLITIRANRVDPEEGRHRVIYAGDVVAIQRGRRVMSDLLVITSRAPDEPGGPGLKEAMWEGDVRVDFGEFGDQAATADRAVYDGEAKTMTLTGNVVVQRGPWVVKNDRLVISVKDQ